MNQAGGGQSWALIGGATVIAVAMVVAAWVVRGARPKPAAAPVAATPNQAALGGGGSAGAGGATPLRRGPGWGFEPTPAEGGDQRPAAPADASSPAPAEGDTPEGDAAAGGAAERDAILAALEASRNDEALRQARARLARLGAAATAEDHFLVGSACFQTQQFEAGLQAFRQAATIEPDNPLARKNLATVLLLRGRPLEALPHAARLCELTPDDVEAWSMHARGLWSAARFTEAVAAATTGLEREAEHVELLQLHARASLMTNDFAAALADGDVLRRLDAQDPWGWLLAAVLRHRGGLREEALALTREALARLDAATLEVAVAHGVLSGVLEQADEAEGQALREQIAQRFGTPADRGVWLGAVGARFLEFNELGAASFFFGLAHQVDPRPSHLRQTGLIKLIGGDVPGALDELERAVAMEAEAADQARTWAALELARGAAGDAEGAREAAERADALHPGQAERTRRIFEVLRRRR